MAWTFNGVGSETSVPDGAHLDIPNSDWSIAGWFKVSDNSDSNFKRLLAWGVVGATPHVQIFLPGTGLAPLTNADHVTARFIGTGGADTGLIWSPSFAVSDHYDEWIPITLTHENATNTTYLRILDRGAHTIYTASSVIGIGAVNIAEPVYIGATVGGANNLRFVGDMAEWAYFPGLFMDVNNFHGYIHGGRSYRFPECAWYVPMIRERVEDWGPSHVTIGTANLTDGLDHPQISLRTPRMMLGGEVLTDPQDQDVDQDLGLVSTAVGVRDLPVSASDTMNLVSLGGRTITGDASSTMNFIHLAAYINLVDDRKPAGHVITFTQLAETLSTLVVESDLGLTQTVNVLGPIKESLTSVLGISQHTSTPYRFEITETLALFDTAFTPAAPILESLSHTMNLIQLGTITNLDHTITFVQIASAAKSDTATSTINMTDVAAVEGIYLRSVTHSDFIGHSLTWWEDSPCNKKQYTPFQGENTVPNAVEPPSDVLQDPQGSTSDRFSLYVPALGAKTDEVILRAPEMDNRDRNAYSRVTRETRGGSLSVYADPDWPKVRTLAVTIIGLTEANVDELQTFMQTYLGQTIGITDWEGRLWSGVITDPEQPAVQDGRGMWTVTFQFEGEISTTEQPGNDDGNGMAMNLSQSATAVIV